MTTAPRYPWPFELLVALRDRSATTAMTAPADGTVADQLAALQLHPSLVGFLSGLYEAAQGATFFNSRLRLYPIAGDPDRGLPNLAAWNHVDGWQQYQPQKINHTFFFCSNTFGDQFGIPIDADGAVLHDRLGMLWVERFEYQEAKINWHTLFPRLADDPAMANFVLRNDEHAWAAGTLGVPLAWQCFSSNVPALLGGPDTIDNIALQSMPVHVSFTLQVIAEAKRRLEPGAATAMVDLKT